MRRHVASFTAAALVLLVFAGQVSADTQGSQPAASPDKNLWLGVVILVLLIASLIVVRPRPRR